MRFRSTSSHAQCSECVKRKALISSLADHLNARKVQQDLLYTHLQAQFRDRSCYWRMRGLARARGLDVVCIQDGIDQSKFIVPRTSLMRAKTFEGFMRPKLHIVGVIAHGRHVAFYISEPNIPKDSNTSCEILADSLQRLAVAGVDLSACSNPAGRQHLQGSQERNTHEVRRQLGERWSDRFWETKFPQNRSLP